MTTIRRIYIFIACFVSLQWTAVSIKSLLDAFLHWLLIGQTEDLRSIVFPLAVVIVGTPIFLGHWLWAQSLARTDPNEQDALERHLYLHLTVGLLTAYLAFAIHSGIEALLYVLLPKALTAITNWEDPLATFISILPTVVALGWLWNYHRKVIAQDEKISSVTAPAKVSTLPFLSNLAFAAIGMALITYGLLFLLEELLYFPQQHTLYSFATSAGLLSAGMGLWAYHQRWLIRTADATAALKVNLRWFYWQGFSFVGWVLTVQGLITTQRWFTDWYNDGYKTTLPTGLAALITGLGVLVYHEWLLHKSGTHEQLRTRRQLYALALNLVSLVMVVNGLSSGLDWLIRVIGREAALIPDTATWLIPGLLTWLYTEREVIPIHKSVRWWQALVLSLFGAYLTAVGLFYTQGWILGRLSQPYTDLASVLSNLLTGLPVFIYYERLVIQNEAQGNAPARWFTAWLAQSIGVWLTTFGMVQTWRWLFDVLSGQHPTVPFAAGWLLPGALLWVYYQRVIANGRSHEPLLTRIAIFAFSGLGISLTTFGLIGVQEWFFSRFSGAPVLHTPDALATLIAGLPLWLYFWRSAQRLFASGAPAEEKSNLRKAYLYLIIYLTVNGAVITIGLLMNGLFRRLFGLPSRGTLPLPLSIIIASVALWAYHAYVLRGDIAKAGESSLQGKMQRLYWYLVAGVGLMAFVLGLSATLSTLLRLATNDAGNSGLAGWLWEELANALALLFAGGPVWASAWFPAQKSALVPENTEMRRSILRKGYLYFYLLAATLSVLIYSVQVVFQLLNGLFGLSDRGVLAELGQSLGFAIIAGVLWVYHVGVLRGDGRFADQEKEQSTQQKALLKGAALQAQKARWQSFRVVVVSTPGETFAQIALKALDDEAPYLNVATVEFANNLAPQATATLAEASLIIAPWTVATPGGAVAQSPARKLIVPLAVAGVEWVGVQPVTAVGPALLRALRPILKAQATAFDKETPSAKE